MKPIDHRRCSCGLAIVLLALATSCASKAPALALVDRLAASTASRESEFETAYRAMVLQIVTAARDSLEQRLESKRHWLR